MDNTLEEIMRGTKEAARHPWLEPLMRLGYAVRGLLYLLIGLLAIQVIIGGRSGGFTDQEGAIATLGAQPFGQVLLILAAAGLVGYSIWGLIRAVFDPQNKGNGLKGWAARLASLVSAVSYGALAYGTIRLLLRLPGGGGGDAEQQAASSVMATPWGGWLVGAAGLVVLGVGVANFFIGLRAHFDMRFKAYQMSPGQLRWANRLGRFGYAARGVVFGLIGIFLIRAAMLNNASEVVGLDGALRELAGQPYGMVLLGIVAAGLMAFGLYSMLGGLWFRFKKP